MDLGILGGAGLEIDVGAVTVTAEGRYDLGLVNVDKTPASSVKHRVFSVLGGVALRLPR